MSVHKLPAGLRILEGLECLAEALGYASAREHTVLGTGAAVDLAWFAAGDQRVPLMIFEVESTASSSMANNAMKVFSQDVDDFVKPLFFSTYCLVAVRTMSELQDCDEHGARTIIGFID